MFTFLFLFPLYYLDNRLSNKYGRRQQLCQIIFALTKVVSKFLYIPIPTKQHKLDQFMIVKLMGTMPIGVVMTTSVILLFVDLTVNYGFVDTGLEIASGYKSIPMYGSW